MLADAKYTSKVREPRAGFTEASSFKESNATGSQCERMNERFRSLRGDTV